MVDNWDQNRQGLPPDQTVMITDSSNVERDEMNALAQDRRAQAGELGSDRVALPGKPYGLAAGDEVIFTDKFRIKRLKRVENGITGTVIHASENEGKVTILTRESPPRKVEVDTQKFSEISLAYAVHIRKGQGLTSETSGILAGGWQTDKEHMYVSLSRARERTDIYISREDLGEQGMDTGAIERLGERMARSRAKKPPSPIRASEQRHLPGPAQADRPGAQPRPSGAPSNPRRSSPPGKPRPSRPRTNRRRSSPTHRPRRSRPSTTPSANAQPCHHRNTSPRPRPPTTPSSSARPSHHNNTSPRPGLTSRQSTSRLRPPRPPRLRDPRVSSRRYSSRAARGSSTTNAPPTLTAVAPSTNSPAKSRRSSTSPSNYAARAPARRRSTQEIAQQTAGREAALERNTQAQAEHERDVDKVLEQQRQRTTRL